jgi:hypothetical protein
VTQAGYRHRIIIVDRSGSMRVIQEGMQSGLKEFLRIEQETPGKLTVSLHDFDHEIRRVHAFATPDEVSAYVLEPRGMTALYDGFATPVTQEGGDLAALPEDERPDDVVVLFVSDGLNNEPGQHHTAADVKRITEHQRDVYGWKFLYIGANQDAVAEGAKLGTQDDQSLTYAATDTGVHVAMASAGVALSRSYSGQSLSYTQEEREAAVTPSNHTSTTGAVPLSFNAAGKGKSTDHKKKLP